jgi:hypothetical protein
VLPVLLAVGTFIVASEGRNGQQGFSVGAESRFVMFDEMSTADSSGGDRLGFQDAPDPVASDLQQAAFRFEAPDSSQGIARFEQIEPVVRPAVEPFLPAVADDLGQGSVGFRFQADDPTGIGRPEQSLQQTAAAMPVDQQPVSPLTGYNEPAPLFEDPAAPIVRQAYGPLDDPTLENLPQAESASNSFSFSGDSPDSAQIPEGGAGEATRTNAASPSDQPSEGFTMQDALSTAAGSSAASAADVPGADVPADVAEAAPAASLRTDSAQGSRTSWPADAATPATGERNVSRAPRMARLPQANLPLVGTPSAPAAPVAELPPAAAVPTSIQPEPPAPLDLEPEAMATEPYELAPEGAYFEEPPLPANCGLGCPRTWYARAELLYARRVNERGVSLTADDFVGLDEFEFQPGGRITLGRIRDCLDGFEIVYTGGLDWSQTSLITGDDLHAEFGSDVLDVSTFHNAQAQRQEYTSTFHSVELNRKWWGWDVISTTIGFRYLHIGEDYRFDSLNLTEGLGTFDIDTKNNLLGAQLGLDMYQPLGRGTISMQSKAGIYGNYIEGNAGLVNAGVRQFAIGDEKGQLAFEAEMGFFAKFQVLPRVNIQAGYEFWYVYGVATPTAQRISTFLSQDDSFDSEDDIFYHGGSIGAEVVW